MTSFSDLNLAEPLDRALRELGHAVPTLIQAQAIPDALKGKDIMGIAQTGTGKTAAFTLPTLHHIFTQEKDAPKRGARVLILAPTRELADQIAVSVRDYGRYMMDLSVACIYGGVPISRQIKRLVHGNDVLVATPGRLIDLLDRKAITLAEIEVLVLDEADQMMDMGFIHALKKIVPLLPKQRQTLFFSATLAPKIKQLSKQFLIDPVHISVTPANTTAEKVEQRMYRVNQADKQDLLSVALLDEDVGRSLVFTRTKHGADRIVKRLAKVGIRAIAIHGNKSQGQRQRALEDYRSGKVNTLIATDIAARGIDIPDITHVFNYEIPNVPEQYVHRIGRTARAERSGIAVAFVDKSEANYLRDIEKLLGEKLPQMDMPEDMNEKLKELNSRDALPAPEKPKPDARKGRGKSKKKGRFSKSGKPENSDKSNRPSDEDGKPRREKSDRVQKQNPSDMPRRANPDSKNPRAKTARPEKTGNRQRSDKPKSEKSRSDRPRSEKPRSGKAPSKTPRAQTAEGRAAQSYSGKGFKKKAKPSRAKRTAARQAQGKSGGPSKPRRKT
ncbi:DEAD/DEAH box helicase [Litorimonas sp.]|uniref:DEAD/DEAH box helicase n=1 Tax=Litorimonas sp. TaxID=1892381 RepID=UPI003A836C97